MNSDIKFLKQKGFRITPAREGILNIFSANEEPLSGPKILNLLKEKSIHVNKTTVYREIDFLVKMGLVEEVKIAGTQVMYEYADRDHHHHLVCEKCGNIQDITINDEAQLTKEIEKRTGFTIKTHSIEFFGICEDCA